MKKLEIIESETLAYPGDKKAYDIVRDDQVVLQHIARTALAPVINQLAGKGDVDWSPFFAARTFQRKAKNKEEFLEVLKTLACVKPQKT